MSESPKDHPVPLAGHQDGNPTDADGYSAPHAPDRLKRRVAASDSTDSGYSSIHSSSTTSTSRTEAYSKQTNLPPARDPRKPAPHAHPKVQKRSTRDRTHPDSICGDPYCTNTTCLRRREALYQYHHPRVHFPLPSSSNESRPPNPFTPFSYLAPGMRHHGYQTSSGYVQPTPASFGHYIDGFPVLPEYGAPTHQSVNHNKMAYYNAYTDQRDMPQPIPPTPQRFDPSFTHGYPGQITGRQSTRPAERLPPIPERYQQQWNYETHREIYQVVPLPPPAPLPQTTHKSQREPKLDSKRIIHDNADVLTEQIGPSSRKPDRESAPKRDGTRPGKDLMRGQLDGTLQTPKTAPRTAPRPKDRRKISTGSAVIDPSTSTSLTNNLSHGHDDSNLLETPGKDLDLNRSDLASGRPTATNNTENATSPVGEQHIVLNPSQDATSLTDNLTPPYLSSIAEAEAEKKDRAPKYSAAPTQYTLAVDAKDLEEPAESSSPALSSLTLDSQIMEEDPPKPTMPDPSISSAPSHQSQETSGGAARLRGPVASASSEEESSLDAAGGVVEEAQPKSKDQQQSQINIVTKFSEAVVRRCRHVADTKLKLSTGLPEIALVLLEMFSQIVLASTESPEEKFAARSVTEHRSAICRRITEAFSSPTLNEKLDLLWGSDTVSKREIDSVLTSPDDERLHTYLVEHAAFAWLVNRIAVAMATSNSTGTDEATRAALLEYIGSSNHFSIRLDWNLRDFLESQYEDAEHVEIASVICICGTVSDAQAISAGEYADMIWPTLGSAVLNGVTAALKNVSGRHQARLPGDDVFSIALRDDATHVNITASPIVALEICEIVTWLATACRASPSPDRISLSKPSVVADSPGKPPGCLVRFTSEDIEAELLQRKNVCWRKLFQNPVIADGYPVCARGPGEDGLELSLQMMLLLGQSPWITLYQGATMLKGFNSLFVPMACPGSSILWHFILDQDGSRLSYNRGLEEISEVYALDDATLQSRRHFVGWTPAADILAGSQLATYDIERSATDISRPAFATLSAVNITVSKIVGVGMTLNRGKKDIPPALTGRRVYENQVASAGDWHVIMHDTLDHRAWLLDGASALAHVSIAGLYSSDKLLKVIAEANDEMEDDFIPRVNQVKHPQGRDGRTTALKVLLNNNNRGIQIFPDIKEEEKSVRSTETGERVEQTQVKTWWRWQDLVTEKFAILELLHDQSCRRKNCPTADIRLPFGPHTIEGFEFDDIVQGSSPLQPRVTKVDSSYGGWLNFTSEIDAITLFASGLGELIKPAEAFSGGASRARCGQRASCPIGYDFLVAPLSVLEQIHKKCRTRREHLENVVRLGEKSFWHDTLVPLEQCDCASRRCAIRIAKLHRSSSHSQQTAAPTSPEEVFKRYARGAVIFGSGEMHSIASAHGATPELSKRAQPPQSARGEALDSGIDMGDSGSSNVSPTSLHADTSPDSGIGPESVGQSEQIRTTSSVVGTSRTRSSRQGGSRSDAHSQRREPSHSSRASSKSGMGWSEWLMRNTHPPPRNRRQLIEAGSTNNQRTQDSRSGDTGHRRERRESPSRTTRRRDREETTLTRRER